MEIEKITLMNLHKIGKIKIEENEGGYFTPENKQEKKWKSADITLNREDGSEEVLVSIDYEDELGLRIMVYDSVSETPVFIKHVVGNKGENDGEADTDLPIS